MKPVARSMNVLKGLIFSSRWLQAPLYLGLIVAQGVYVYHFGYELFHLFHVKPTEKQCLEVPGRSDRIQKLVRQNTRLRQENQDLRKKTGAPGKSPAPVSKPAAGTGSTSPAVKAKTGKQCPRPDEQVWVSAETMVMLLVLTLIDVVMIANLLIMVIIGGYETFVSRLQLQTHPDKPEWLSQVNASVLKVKLAMALIGISSIHLLRTFILVPYYEYNTVFWHVVIHLTFLISAIAMAVTDRIMHPPHVHSKHE